MFVDEALPPSGPDTRPTAPQSGALQRPLLHVLGVVALAALLYVGYGGGHVAIDGMWSLVWGRDLAAASGLTHSGTTVPHLLSNAIGLGLVPLGRNADTGLVILTFFAAGAAIWITGLLAWQLAGPIAAVAAGALFASREQLLYATTSAFVDVIFTALLLWAVLLAVRGLRAGRTAPPAVIVLLLLAGLLRPEAWLLAGVYWLWTAWHTRQPRVGQLGVVLAAPVLWFGADAVLSGSLTYGLRVNASVNDRIIAARGINHDLPHRLLDVLQAVGRAAAPELVVVGFLALGVLLWTSRRQATRIARAAWAPWILVLVTIALFVAALTAEALSGALLVARFALPVAALLCAIVAATLVRLGNSSVARADPARTTRPHVGEPAPLAVPADDRSSDQTAPRPLSGAAGAIVFAVFALAVFAQLPLIINARAETQDRRSVVLEARRAITPDLVRCTPVVIPNATIRASVAVWTDVRGRQVVDGGTQPIPARATFITGTGPRASSFVFDRAFRTADPFPTAKLLREQAGWVATSTCTP